MTNLENDRNLGRRFVAKAFRLNPEVVRGSGTRQQDDREGSSGSFHDKANAHLSHRLRNRSSYLKTLFAVALTATAVPASAHQGTGLAGGFASGFLHPFTGADHMLAMISVGLWGAFLGRPLLFLLPMIFPAMMAFGAALGMAGVPVPPVQIGIAISVLMLGSLILMAARLPVVLACVIVAIFALFHGYAHGIELPSAADPVGYSAGFVLATGLLHLLGIGIGALKNAPYGDRLLRAGGGLIALAGVGFLVSAVAS